MWTLQERLMMIYKCLIDNEAEEICKNKVLWKKWILHLLFILSYSLLFIDAFNLGQENIF